MLNYKTNISYKMKNMFDLEPNKETIKLMSEIRIIKQNLIHVQGLPKSLLLLKF